ncbi:MAG: ABC transporter permease [Paludibaculum sp.]
MFGGRTSTQVGGEQAGRRVMWTIYDHTLLAPQTPSCEFVIPELTRGSVAVRSDYNSATLLISGSQPPYQRLRALAVDEGRFFSWEDDSQGRRVAFIGSDVRKQLFKGRKALGETLTINGIPYQVIGVMKTKEQDSSYDGRDINKIFIPYGAMVRDLPQPPPFPPGTMDQMIVKAWSLNVHETCVAEVRRGLARIHNFDPDDKDAAAIWDTVEQSRAFATMADGMSTSWAPWVS